MFKVKVFDYMELVYIEYFDTLKEAKIDFQAQLDYIAGEKAYDTELQPLQFGVQLVKVADDDQPEKILKSVSA